MSKFEWDDRKAASNQRKHGLSFEDAREVFRDEDRLQYIREGEERRYITIGKAFAIIMTVVYTTRDVALRLISARRASREERNDYLSNKLK